MWGPGCQHRDDWQWLLRDAANRGTCVVSPIVTHGEKSIPASRTVTIVGHIVKHVNFKINAPLKVTITAENVTGRSGLAIFKNFSTTEAESRAFFTRPGSLNCVSGCWNVLATVTDPDTGDPVKGATVNASVGRFPTSAARLPPARTTSVSRTLRPIAGRTSF